MGHREIIEVVADAIEIGGVVVTVLGIVVALVLFAVSLIRRRELMASYRQLRHHIGRSVLLGLELLVAGDIIGTVAVPPSFRSVGVLAAVVVIRTFLSFTLEVELTGHWPWQGTPERRMAAAEEDGPAS